MRARGRLLAWLAVLYGAALAVALAALAMLYAGLPEAEAEVLGRVLRLRAPLLAFLAIVLLFVCAAAARWAFSRHVTAAHALAEQTRIVTGANPELRLAPDRGALGEVARAINALGDARRALKRDSEARAAEARSRLEEERNRLAALMSELSQGVLVCNPEGAILLYNEQAHALFSAPAAAGAPGLVGLGRSLFALLDRGQVAHAEQRLQHALARGEHRPSVRFVASTPGGRLLRVQLAPFLRAEAELAGLVLTLEDATALLARESQRRSLLQAFAGRIRAPAANIRAAAENLAAFGEIEPQRRTQFIGIVAEESHRLSRTIDEALGEYADALKASLSLEDIRAAELLEFARTRLEQALGIGAEIAAVEPELWLRVDSYALVQAMVHLGGRLSADYGVRLLELRARRAEGLAQIDLAWTGAIVSSDALPLWEAEPIEAGAERSPLTVRDILERHGGEVWYQRSAVGGTQQGCFRFLVGAGVPSVAPVPRRMAESRPEYYDFDLFARRALPSELHQARLAALSYTVFDTETTGLEPSAGDEIISIGAVRIVNGRLLRSEAFEQLVNPRRPLNPRSAPVHGIDPAALAAQPAISEVLPAFRRFCEDTVLVAHNAAFDMRFLELKEASTGLRFDMPVLDTLLLSSVVNPSVEDHRLEAIAERLGLSVIGRHTALGDALLAGEVFLRLLALLAERGIVTLGEALEASRQTYYARLRY